MEKSNNIKNKDKTPIAKLLCSFYSNALSTSFSDREIIIEYLQTPSQEDGKVDAIRIILVPETFKRFINSFQKVLKKYEEMNGEIKIKKDWRTKEKIK